MKLQLHNRMESGEGVRENDKEGICTIYSELYVRNRRDQPPELNL